MINFFSPAETSLKFLNALPCNKFLAGVSISFFKGFLGARALKIFNIRIPSKQASVFGASLFVVEKGLDKLIENKVNPQNKNLRLAILTIKVGLSILLANKITGATTQRNPHTFFESCQLVALDLGFTFFTFKFYTSFLKK